MRVLLDKGAFAPEKAYADDAGYDIRTPIKIVVPPTQVCPNSFDAYVGEVKVDTGVHVEIPRGYVGMLKSKSGLNLKHDIIGEGVIDSGYTGSIKVKLYNMGDFPHVFQRGDKIIQLVVVPCLSEEIEVVDHLEDTERGENGFGSTGR